MHCDEDSDVPSGAHSTIDNGLLTSAVVDAPHYLRHLCVVIQPQPEAVAQTRYVQRRVQRIRYPAAVPGGVLKLYVGSKVQAEGVTVR